MPRIPLNVAATLPRTLGPPPKPLPKNFKPTDADARSLYRSLWRVGSLSVMYTNPGHDVIRRKIREAFEKSQQHPKMDPTDIRQQWERGMCILKFFFEIASTRFGVEHSVISNLCRIAAEGNTRTPRGQKANMRKMQKEVTDDYNSVIHALNESMGLSLR
ncbi:hypothetical protein BGZ51_004617 [Haplosporangium sp. Z 767]|nr:hypothetical protein BGZ51_004617 [Haplosporangium sp. Z 767]KAF9195532.1 hypothetical protein BGZ50_004332 [Haplosporangium sp. Z 11]